MSPEGDSFKDYMYRGLDSLMRITSKAGESLKTFSSDAIERIDLARLERQLDGKYSSLGKKIFDIIEAGQKVSSKDKEISDVIEEIRVLKERLFFGKSGVKAAEKAESDEPGKL